MFKSCIHCLADLGTNRLLPAFPVGDIAYDVAKGRIWAVCRGCGRWTLAPLEERWEALEQAERAWRGAGLSRVAGDEVAMARLPEGNRIIRVGKSTDSGLALWRYGRLLRRRTVPGVLEQVADSSARYAAVLAALTVTPALGASLLTTGGLVAGVVLIVDLPRRLYWRRQARQILLRTEGRDPRLIRLVDTIGARLTLDDQGKMAVRLETEVLDEIRTSLRWTTGVQPIRESLTLRGEPALRLLRRLMPFVNRRGASRTQVEAALAAITLAGGPDEFMLAIAQKSYGVGGRRGHRPRKAPRLVPVLDSIAFELALQESSERRAVRGELRTLQEDWREAEEIAAIADSL